VCVYLSLARVVGCYVGRQRERKLSEQSVWPVARCRGRGGGARRLHLVIGETTSTPAAARAAGAPGILLAQVVAYLAIRLAAGEHVREHARLEAELVDARDGERERLGVVALQRSFDHEREARHDFRRVAEWLQGGADDRPNLVDGGDDGRVQRVPGQLGGRGFGLRAYSVPLGAALLRDALQVEARAALAARRAAAEGVVLADALDLGEAARRARDVRLRGPVRLHVLRRLGHQFD